MRECAQSYQEVVTCVHGAAHARHLHHDLFHTYQKVMTDMYGDQCEIYDPEMFEGDVVIVWSGNDFVEYDKQTHQHMVKRRLSEERREDIRKFCDYLGKFKNP